MDNISNHITYDEATFTDTGLLNRPDPIQIGRMQLVATKVFEPLREHFNRPIGISSFFRSPAVNYKIGGARTSQHLLGEAIDIDADCYGELTNADIFRWLRLNVDFDQLIYEFGTDDNPSWIHISYTSTGNRRQVLRSVKEGNKTIYRLY